MNPSEPLPVEWLGRIGFADALARQEAEVAAVRAAASPGRLFLLEHDPVFTIGRTRDQSSLPPRDRLPAPLYEINRGGQATWHGPGQLVGYAVLDLHHHGSDLARYLRFLEQVLINALARWSLDGGRRDGLTGVWVAERKIASIGVGVRHWVSMHGFALNVCGPLEGFASIIPCGIAGVEMTSIERERGEAVTVREVAAAVAEIFQASLPALA
ncbi:MAG: lipoyl(octanoyl) transferase LipB [Terrimicrobiaceae bacterium]|nr:lipoyl(octanoyl) transferase LipB [Terrimicrobiaceae bacterium]